MYVCVCTYVLAHELLLLIKIIIGRVAALRYRIFVKTK